MDWSRYPNFSESEFECGCGCGRAEMTQEFMDKLQQVRDALGKPMTVSSGFRCADHNKAIGGAEHSKHLEGRAADIHVAGIDARNLLSVSLPVMNGIGVAQKGPWNARFVHLDDRDDAQVIWSY